MTQETKLGLVIGGVFILCFAVILSNSAQEPIMAQRVGALKEFSAASPPLTEALTGRVPPSAAPEPDRTRSAQPIRPPTTAASGNDRYTEAPTPTGQRVIAGADSEVAAASRQSPTPTSSLSSRLMVTDVITNRSRPVVLPYDATGINDSLQQAGTAPAAAREASRAEPGGQQYTVRTGDNLTKIAQTVYGTASAEAVERLFEANRATLKSKDAVRVGQTLVIPLSQGRQIRKPQPTQEQSAERTPARPEPTREWVWYQVKQDDRYAKIAQEQLGDASRWREIFELNSSVFPDPNRIRPGVRIKIPK